MNVVKEIILLHHKLIRVIMLSYSYFKFDL